MPTTENAEWMSVEEYLAFEERSPIRHEYVCGRIVAMTGTTQRHNTIASNINSILRSHLKGGPCCAFIIDLKVHVSAVNSFYYPDGVVACSKRSDDSVIVAEPILIVEVLSPSTAAVDRREKVIAYRQIPSLREYLIVGTKRKQIELHRRNDTGAWDVLQFVNDDKLELISVQPSPLIVGLRSIYVDTDLENQPALEVREECADYMLDEFAEE
ncbi:MAG TPA: Uma2 family endonuclease [Trichormus sp.]|jgi:Uma2 family endonuclease